MNQHFIHPQAEPTGSHSIPAADQEARNMRSLALQLRRNSHQYRQWAREEAAKGHIGAGAIFFARANRYAADALWYWRRGRQVGAL